MNYWQYRKIIDPMLKELPVNIAAEFLEDEHEAVLSNIAKYVERRCGIVESIISQLPHKDTRGLVNIGSGARLIVRALERKIITTEQSYRTHEHALLYGIPKEEIGSGLREITHAYEHLAQVAFGMANRRVGRSSNLLPLDKTKWLER